MNLFLKPIPAAICAITMTSAAANAAVVVYSDPVDFLTAIATRADSPTFEFFDDQKSVSQIQTFQSGLVTENSEPVSGLDSAVFNSYYVNSVIGGGAPGFISDRVTFRFPDEIFAFGIGGLEIFQDPSGAIGQDLDFSFVDKDGLQTVSLDTVQTQNGGFIGIVSDSAFEVGWFSTNLDSTPQDFRIDGLAWYSDKVISPVPLPAGFPLLIGAVFAVAGVAVRSNRNA